jgi:thiol:disulfide interchange protein DsbD
MTTLFLLVPAFLIFGILLGLTPCAVPLLLIMTSVCNNGTTSAMKKSLALTYMISLGCAYALVGLAVSVFAFYFYSYLQMPAVIVAMSLLFIFLGFATLGLLHLQLFPRQWLQLLQPLQRTFQHNPYLDAIFIGSTATLMASPCVIAPLAGLLWFIAENNHPGTSITILFFTGIGFGIPVIALSTFGTELLQIVGRWQKLIKQFFGLLLLGIAIHMLQDIISNRITMLLWATLVIFAGIYMGALIPDETNPILDNQKEQCQLNGEESPLKKRQLLKNIKHVSKLLSLLILLYGVLIFTGFLLGNSNPLSPLT